MLTGCMECKHWGFAASNTPRRSSKEVVGCFCTSLDSVTDLGFLDEIAEGIGDLMESTLNSGYSLMLCSGKCVSITLGS